MIIYYINSIYFVLICEAYNKYGARLKKFMNTKPREMRHYSRSYLNYI